MIVTQFLLISTSKKFIENSMENKHTHILMIGCDGLRGGGGGGGLRPKPAMPSNNHEEHMTLESCEC